MRGGANLLTAVLIGVQLAAFERPAALTIPRGTDIPVTLDENVTLKRDQVGNTFPAHITRDILVNGVVAIRAGVPAQVVLVESENTPGAASFRLVTVSIRGDMICPVNAIPSVSRSNPTPIIQVSSRGYLKAPNRNTWVMWAC